MRSVCVAYSGATEVVLLLKLGGNEVFNPAKHDVGVTVKIVSCNGGHIKKGKSRRNFPLILNQIKVFGHLGTINR
jgi:hypothetical protein